MPQTSQRSEPSDWNLESFLDSLIVELDRAQDTLAVKGLTRRLTYRVQDLSMDLHVFPRFDAGKIRFTTARPGEDGASKISLQLGSITDRQIRETSNEPVSREEIAVDDMEGLDDEVKDSLRKVGVNSTRDLERLEQRNVDLPKIVSDKTERKKTVSYGDLANVIKQARRRRSSPLVDRVRARSLGSADEIILEGSNLALEGRAADYPAALLDGEPARILSAEEGEIRFEVPRRLGRGSHTLEVALDTHALMRMQIEGEDS